MDKFSRKSDDITYEGSREWDYDCEEKQLELRLGPPGEENWNTKKDNGISNTCKSSSSNYSARRKINTCSPLLSLGLDQQFLASSDHQEEDNTNIWINVNHHNFSSDNYLQVVENKKSSPWSNISSSSSSCQYKQSCCLPPAMGKKSLQIKDSCGSAQLMVELQQNAENNTNTAVSDQKRSATVPAAPVVGWPPIRSFRKNLASSCASKLPAAKAEASNEVSKKIANKKQTQSYCGKGFFVKINMDGVPIGRKVDLKAYDSYEKLSSVVDELFRGLLAAQIDPSASDFQNNQEGEKTITGLLDGSGEYTLVYEDNEGDRMLVGDVPWSMFVSTVKRLRVQKSSELSSLLFGGKQEKETT